MKNLVQLVLLSLISLSVLANQPETIEGVWLNEKGSGFIEIKINDGVLNGTIIGSPLPEDNLRKDENNPDPQLRDRLLKGVVILNDFTNAGENLWKGGTIYDPDNGKTYDCKITVLDENKIEVRGYVGVSLFGRTEIWERR